MGRNTLNINEYEYKLLKKQWEEVQGAAYNACYEYCYENGYIDHLSVVTPKGEKQIKLFEKKDLTNP